MATATRQKELGEASNAKEQPQSDFDLLMAKNAVAIERIDCISEEDLLLLRQGFSATIKVALAIKELRSLLTDEILQCIMALQGSPLGFLTDKVYPVDIVRDVTIDATIRGFRMTGNEINIISGRLYPAKEGLRRKVREFEGLSHLRMEAGVPHSNDTGALVEYHAEWDLWGNREEIHCVKTETSDTRIPVKANKGMGADAILGKAERKMLAKIYGRISGSEQYSGDTADLTAQGAAQEPADIPQATDETPSPSSLLETLLVEMASVASLTDIAGILDRGTQLISKDFNELELAGQMKTMIIRENRGERSNDDNRGGQPMHDKEELMARKPGGTV